MSCQNWFVVRERQVEQFESRLLNLCHLKGWYRVLIYFSFPTRSSPADQPMSVAPLRGILQLDNLLVLRC